MGDDWVLEPVFEHVSHLVILGVKPLDAAQEKDREQRVDGKCGENQDFHRRFLLLSVTVNR